jgi:intein/homing endonuclease
MCGTSVGCLASGTLVLMGDGKTRRIDDIRSGDYVLSDDPNDSLKPEPKVVEVQVLNASESLIHVSFASVISVGNVREISLTSGHPLYLVDRGWCRAGDLKLGDLLVDPFGRQCEIKGLRTEEKSAVTFNIDVADLHTFYVSDGGDDWVLVHNGEFDVGNYSNKDYPWIRHHGIMNKWLEVHFPFAYKSRALARSFPCMSLSKPQHDLATRMERNFMRGRNMKDVSAHEVKKLAEDIFDAIGVPGSMRTYYFQTMNMWLAGKIGVKCPL